MPVIKYSGTEGAAYSPLPKGTYELNIDDVKLVQAKSSGNQQLELTATVLGSNEHGTQYDGRTVKDWLVITEAAGFKIGQLLNATIPGQFTQVETGRALEPKDGAANKKAQPLYEYEFDTDDLIGVSCVVIATIEDDNKGEARNRFKYIAKAKSLEAAPAQTGTQQAPAAAPAAAQTQPAPGNIAPPAGAPQRRRLAQ